MTNHSYILFNKSPDQLRLLGAHGGRTFSRNQRVRRLRALPVPPPQTAPSCAECQVTAAESIVVLDARFPWLRGAEKR